MTTVETTTSSGNLILIEQRTGAPMHLTYNLLSSTTVELVCHSVTVNGSLGSGGQSKLEFPIDDYPYLFPVHNPSGDVVVYRDYPVVAGFEPSTSYFDMKASSDKRLLVMELSREYRPGEPIKVRTVDMSYLANE